MVQYAPVIPGNLTKSQITYCVERRLDLVHREVGKPVGEGRSAGEEGGANPVRGGAEAEVEARLFTYVGRSEPQARATVDFEWIHNELRRICGGPPVAAATRDQLSARIEAVRGLTS